LLSGCTAASTPAAPSTVVTGTNTEYVTPPAPPPPTATGTYRPEPATSVHPVPYGARPPKGEQVRPCPYIKTGLDQTSGTGVNLADLEGDRVYLTTVLTRYKPVGCRFYFYAPPYEAITDIRPTRFPTAAAAYDAMIRTANAGSEQITERNFVKGLVGICYRTVYFGPDGARDWAFVFAKGKTMVNVLTQRNDTSRNALYIAQAIAAKF
jgi:hypothetical protein